MATRSILRPLLICASFASFVAAATPRSLGVNPVCTQIAKAISPASDVFFTGLSYFRDIDHWATSSTQQSDCTVEPGTASDVGAILRILGSANQTFAVKGGGHTMNPGFSSTEGVHISMSRFSDVLFDKDSQTVVVGSGLIWDDVYKVLENFGVNVVGGRVTGVGVAGFTLGGGYSWLTNQHGLTVDTVTAYELVTPDGVVRNVTNQSDSDLFFALKGGFNNFGIVTRFTLRTFPQGSVWGGVTMYTANEIDAVSLAVLDFATNVTDPKAAIITTYNFLLGEPGITHLMFYDGPKPPAGIFDAFSKIPHLFQDVKTRSFLSLVLSPPSNATSNARGLFNTVSFSGYNTDLMKVIKNETIFWGSHLAPLSASFISYQIEPFLPNIFAFSNQQTAFPPDRSRLALPFNIYYAWELPAFDSKFHDAIKESAQHLVASAPQATSLPVYPNYAVWDTPLEMMYGGNVGRLGEIKRRVDPNNTMGLTGGFKF